MSNFDGDNVSMPNEYPEIKEDIHIYKNAFYINPCILGANLSNTTLDIPHNNNANTKLNTDIKTDIKSSENTNTKTKNENNEKPEPALSTQALHEAILALKLEGKWKIVETPQGLIVAFTRKDESQDIFEKIDIAKVLKSPVQVATLPQQCQHQQQLIYQENQRRDIHQQQMAPPSSQSTQSTTTCGECTYIQNRMSNYFNGQCMCPRSNQESMGRSRWMLVRDVPWSIPVKDIRHALEMQGIHIIAIERWRQHIRIEIKSLRQYEYLQLEGLNFYGVSRFFVTAERWNNSNTSNANTDHHLGTNTDEVLQCYRCQGFWHVALNCRHIPRCVRCGEPHAVEYCVRPRNNPICCNCSGPHHAAYKGCPVRKQMSQAAPVFFTLSKYLPEKSSAPLTPNLNSKEPRCWL